MDDKIATMSTKNNDKLEAWLNFSDFFDYIWKDKFFVISSVISFSIFFVLLSFVVPKIYKANLLVHVNESNFNEDIEGLNFSNLVMGPRNSSTFNLELEKAQSKLFLDKFVRDNFMSEELIIFSSDFFGKDLTDEIFLAKYIESQNDYLKWFLRKFNIEIKKSNIINLTLTYSSPKNLDSLLLNLNDSFNQYRMDQEKIILEKRLAYLGAVISENNLNSFVNAISSIIEKDLRRMALIESEQEFVFQKLDRVTTNLQFPKVVYFLFIGLILSFFIISVKYLLHQKKNSTFK